jgi:hypothetical protein
MNRTVLTAVIALISAVPAAAQKPAESTLPHAWLLGSWTGGLFPPPVGLPARECLASPTVIFTRDAVLRAMQTDVTYQQSIVETVRAIPGGVEFRLSTPAHSTPSTGSFGLTAQAPAQDPGFGCDQPGLLRVQRRGEDQIAFPGCAAFPYPLLRCPSQ